MKRDSGMLAATCFAGARHVCPARFAGAVCLRRFVFVNTVAGGAAVGGGSRMTDKEKEESCGL